MKILVLLSLLSCCVYAGDNCYVFERGSDSWARCKEQAADSEKRMNAIQADTQAMNLAYEMQRLATAQNEANRLAQQERARRNREEQ